MRCYDKEYSAILEDKLEGCNSIYCHPGHIRGAINEKLGKHIKLQSKFSVSINWKASHGHAMLPFCYVADSQETLGVIHVSWRLSPLSWDDGLERYEVSVVKVYYYGE